MATTPQNAAASRLARRRIDVRAEAEQVRAPTLVLHARDDQAASFERGRLIASVIPGARLVPLASRNHILLAGEPAWDTFVAEVTAFLGADRPPDGAAVPMPPLQQSAREAEIVHLASLGHDNTAIAGTLHLSVRTVERHLQNVYLKAGVGGRTARTAVVARYLARA